MTRATMCRLHSLLRATLALAILAGAALLSLMAGPPARAGATPGADRVHALATELRCPVCQNQNLADSNADLAVDLRREIEKQVAAGRTDDEIRSFMVERYGHYVLYDPPLAAHTLLLWAAPALLLLGAGGVAWRHLRAHPRHASAETPSP